ncbi:MAG TPA: AarF/UbiB family protein [Candidatus Saccharimonadales bacterium]|nr:AarF/UbiB family protein [Candidatus Saccharimonadales bacterium]
MATNHAKTIAAIKRARTKRLAKLGARAYYLKRRGRDQEMYDLLCNEFLSLGGVYVKFMQGVMFNSPAMKRWNSPARLKIFENLDSQPLDIVSVLRHELPPEKLQQIVLVQPEPFAAGSFGQVYMAQHANGQKIIIKALRPLVRELLKYDLRLLGLFGKRFAAHEYTNFTIKMNAAIKEFRNATLNETDYLAEVKFANELYEAYQDHPHIVIPKTYTDLSTPHIIVQEYLDGISGAELLKIQADGGDPARFIEHQTGSDLDTQLRIAGIESLTAIFTLPRIPGDPHPGNIRFMTKNRVGLIDFGISAPVPRNRAAFFSLLSEWNRIYENQGTVAGMFEQFMRYFVNDLYRALKKLSTITPGATSLSQTAAQYMSLEPPKQESNDLIREIGRLVQNAFDNATGANDLRVLVEDGQLMRAFGQIANKDNRLGLVVRLESSEILRAAQTYISMLQSLKRRKLFGSILADAIKEIARQYPDLIHQTEKSVSASQAIEIINRWLERVAVRDPALFMQLLKRIRPREDAAKYQTEEGTIDA